MRHKGPFWGLVLTALFMASGAAWAGSLRSDYRTFVVKRQQLEKERRKHEVEIKKLKLAQRTLSHDLYKCAIKRDDDLWVKRLDAVQEKNDRLETTRTSLFSLRKELNKVRMEVENMRAAIEQKYRKKAKGSEYEREFRRYMGDLEERYFRRINTELFFGYEAYFKEIGEHVSFLKKSVEECKKAGANP